MATEEQVRRKARVIAGFMSQEDATVYANNEVLDAKAFMAEWKQRADARSKLPPKYEVPKVEDLPPGCDAHVKAVTSNPLFAQVYGTAELKWVELGKLIAIQWSMDTDVSEGVHAVGSAATPTLDDLLRKCLPLEIIPPSDGTFWNVHEVPGVRTVIRAHSLNNTFNVIVRGYDKSTGQVGFVLGAGANLMLVREFQGRYVLANGYHRAWWLRSKGVDMVPVVLNRVTTPDDFGGGLTQLPRPPVIDDFLDDTVSVTAEVRAFMRVVTVTAEALFVPRLL